jgi:hypothetical protein
MAAIEHIPVGVLVEKKPVDSPWIDHVWLPRAVLPTPPEAAAWTLLSRENGVELWYAGQTAISLYSSDTGHLVENLLPEALKLWVALRPTGQPGDVSPPLELIGVTADPSEGEGMNEGGGDIVEVVPMPPEIAARIADFFSAHHVERPFHKRQRGKHDPNAARRPPGGPVPDGGERRK